MSHLRSFLVPAALVAFVACSSTPPSPDASASSVGSCDAIAAACHPYSKISAVGNECHALGHDGDDARCGPERDRCIAACPPRDASAEEHDASIDATSDAPAASRACVDLCTCLDTSCKTKAGYPFASQAACLATCASWSEAQQTCYPKFCRQAQTTPTAHVCEHAWGSHGLDECDTL